MTTGRRKPEAAKSRPTTPRASAGADVDSMGGDQVPGPAVHRATSLTGPGIALAVTATSHSAVHGGRDFRLADRRLRP